MAAPLVQAEALSKAFGGRVLLDNASFQLEKGERVALVGPNGSGKTTLLEMVAGRASPDSGMVNVARNARITYFTQHGEHAKDATVRSVFSAGGEAPPEMVAELAQLESRMADPALYESDEANAVVARYGELQREIALASAAGGADPLQSPFFAQLGFTEDDLERRVASLSGGERTRLLLAKVLSGVDPEGLLILDEPTNHLDVESIEWLEEWLQDWPGTVFLVAHDRAFLDNVTTRVVAIRDGRLVSVPGNYSEFERVTEEDQARLLARREREAKEMARQKAVMEQFRHQKRFDGQYASRMQRLEKYRAAIEKTPDPLVQKVQMHVAFPATHKSSTDVMRVRGLGKRFGEPGTAAERLLFYDLDLDVSKGDRMALVGTNGAGKTTLLRILTGKDRKDVGNIEIAPGVKGAYFAQGHANLDVERTLRHEVLNARPGLEDEDVRALLGRFGFRHAEDLHRKVSSLSGGERSRLSLLKTILTPSNLLILDEPTNHLDLESRKALVRALNAYQGTLLVVSHDRWFLDSVVSKVAVLARRKVKVFTGDFTEARMVASMGEFATEKPLRYVVKKAFSDYDGGGRHTVGSVIELTPAEVSEKRIYRTALSMGWMAEE